MSNFLNDTTLLLANNITYNRINQLIGLFSERKRQVAYQKHFGVGTTIKRRDTKKETAYGECKRALEFLAVVKNIKKNTGMYEIDMSSENKNFAKSMISEKLGSYYQRYWSI